MSHVLEAIAGTVGAAAILAIIGGVIRMALLIRDTSRSVTGLARKVGELQDTTAGHERRLSRVEGFQRGLAGWLGGGGRHR